MHIGSHRKGCCSLRSSCRGFVSARRCIKHISVHNLATSGPAAPICWTRACTRAVQCRSEGCPQSAVHPTRECIAHCWDSIGMRPSWPWGALSGRTLVDLALTARWLNCRVQMPTSMQTYSGTVGAIKVHLAHNGHCSRFDVDLVGTNAATLTTYLAVQAFKPSLVISAGTAGRLPAPCRWLTVFYGLPFCLFITTTACWGCGVRRSARRRPSLA